MAEDNVSSPRNNDQENENENENPFPIEKMKRSRKKALLEFRCRVEDAILKNYLLGKKPPSNENTTQNLDQITLWGVPLLPSKGHDSTDVILMKFLKARDFKVSEAFIMLRRTLKWRNEMKMENILEENYGSDLDNAGSINGTDKMGRPLCYNLYGVYKEKELYKKRFGTEENCQEFLRWKVQFMEKCVGKLSFVPGEANSIVQIIDLNSLPGPAMKEIRLISKKSTMVLQENYPGIIFKNVIINVPLWVFAFHAFHLRFITQRYKSKFVFVRPSKVTETLLKFVVPENIPVQYGGLKREDEKEFSLHDKVFQQSLKSGAIETIEIHTAEPEVEKTMVWEMTVPGYEVIYTEKFVPDDDCSYTVLLQEEKKLRKIVRNSFHIREPGKIVISIENRTFKKKKLLYRYKFTPIVPMYASSK